MFTEDDLLPISALQHLEFCPRQCGLIHLENIWTENRLTAEGRGVHEKAHEPQGESRPGIRIARSLRLHSFRLGLCGQADVVEFHKIANCCEGGVLLDGVGGKWQPIPVEYKRGSPKISHCDMIQLCAQAICLEEMLGVTITQGALFYGKPRRRQQIEFSDTLRKETEGASAKLHELFNSRQTPKASYSKKCESCSLVAMCMPKTTGINKNIERYLANAKNIDEEQNS